MEEGFRLTGGGGRRSTGPGQEMPKLLVTAGSLDLAWVGVHRGATVIDGFGAQFVVPGFVAVDLAQLVLGTMFGQPRPGIEGPNVDRRPPRSCSARAITPSQKARPRESDPHEPEGERKPKRYHWRKTHETSDLGDKGCDSQGEGESPVVCPALVAAEGNRQDERRCEPRRQTEEESDPVDQSGRSFLRARGVNVACAQEEICDRREREEDDSGDSGLGTCHRSAEDERKRADAGGTREEGDVHQPSEVAQRILAGRVAVVELWLEYVEEGDQGYAKQRPGNCKSSRPMSPLGGTGASTIRAERILVR